MTMPAKKAEKKGEENIIEHTVDSVVSLRPDTKLKVIIGNDVFLLRPINVVDYHTYLKNMEGNEVEAEIGLVTACLLEPKVSSEELKQYPYGIVRALLDTLVELSFLQREG